MVKFNSDITIMKSALQGMMRAQLIKDGKQYVKDGTITELELYDWKGRYEAYHKLGVNGVLDALNEEIISIAIHN